ncbi:MAG: hypothetical protein NTY22_07785 [Proteobacteria bacterium]|nr:hypothetical protein [Pseudomonadota bacterium]
MIIEHTLDPLKVILEIYRILRPGAFCIIAAPNTDSLESFINLRLNRPIYSPDHHEWHLFHYTPKTLAKILRKSGFNQFRIIPDLTSFPILSHDLRKTTRKVLSFIVDTVLPTSKKNAMIAVAYKD